MKNKKSLTACNFATPWDTWIICSVPLEWTCSEVEKLEGEVSFLRAKFSIPRSNGLFSRSDSCQNQAKRDFGSPDREKGPFDQGNENFARRKE